MISRFMNMLERTRAGASVERAASRECPPSNSPPVGDNPVVEGLLYYYVTSLPVVVGILLGVQHIERCTTHPDSTKATSGDVFSRMIVWDGVWYQDIAENGYSYAPSAMSSVAFFPLYPLLVRGLSLATGLRTEVAMVVLSQLALVGSFALLSAYLRLRTPPCSLRVRNFTLAAFGLFPTTFYMRMPYTESLFVFLLILLLLAQERGWPVVVVALIAGTLTATRTVGIAAMPVAVWYAWHSRPSGRPAFAHLLWLAPTACWGLLAYMAYQWWAFGNPLAFVQTQSHWADYSGYRGLSDKLLALITFKPFWMVYLAKSPAHWSHFPPHDPAILNMQFWNPLYVLLGWIVLGYGWKRGLLSVAESWLCVGLVAIPYVLHADRTGMQSGGRYLSIVVPMYIVLAHAVSSLRRCPALLVGAATASVTLLLVNSSLFVAWYYFF